MKLGAVRAFTHSGFVPQYEIVLHKQAYRTQEKQIRESGY